MFRHIILHMNTSILIERSLTQITCDNNFRIKLLQTCDCTEIELQPAAIENVCFV